MSESSGRHWVGHAYYYLAALVGLGFVIGGLVVSTQGLLKAALPTADPEFHYRAEVEPREFGNGKPASSPSPEQVRRAKREARSMLRTEGLYGALEGVTFAGVGFPVFWWHIRRARERERGEPAAV